MAAGSRQAPKIPAGRRASQRPCRSSRQACRIVSPQRGQIGKNTVAVRHAQLLRPQQRVDPLPDLTWGRPGCRYTWRRSQALPLPRSASTWLEKYIG